MIHLPLPTIDGIDMFMKCIKRYPEEFSQADIKEVLSVVERLYKNYHQCLTTKKTFEIIRSEPFGKFTERKMKNLYHEQVVGKDGICRDEYNRLLASARRKKCPMCSESTVTALDHHLPKQTYYFFSVHPNNLVPICSRCNEAKKNTMPDRPEKQFIHPYYDDFSQGSWFEMIFTQKNPIEINYICKPEPDLPKEEQAKLRNHFSRLKLDELYASNAIVKIEDMKNTFSQFLKTKDWNAVRQEIENCLRMVEKRPDSWEYALYSKLLTQQWYIEGGFNNIE